MLFGIVFDETILESNNLRGKFIFKQKMKYYNLKMVSDHFGL